MVFIIVGQFWRTISVRLFVTVAMLAESVEHAAPRLVTARRFLAFPCRPNRRIRLAAKEDNLLTVIPAVLVVATVVTAQAQEKGSAKGGATLLSKPVKTTQDIEAHRPGDAVVMSGAKCKTVTVNYVERTKGQIKEDKSCVCRR